MTPRQSHNELLYERYLLVYKYYIKLLQLMKLRSQDKATHLFCVFIVYGYFETLLRCPSLVGIPKLGHGNLMSVLEALWVQPPKKLVIFSIYEQKTRKTTTELG